MALSPQDAARTHAAMRCAPSPQPSIFPSDFRLHHHTHAALRATHGHAHIRSAAPWQVALLIGCALTASSPRCRHSRRSLRGEAGRWLARPQCPIFRASGRRSTASVACLREDGQGQQMSCCVQAEGARAARERRCLARRPRGAAAAPQAEGPEAPSSTHAFSALHFAMCALAMSGFHCLRVVAFVPLCLNTLYARFVSCLYSL